LRIAIYGAGGLGAYYGARLHAAGHEVGFIARGAHLAAMRGNGLQLYSPLGDVHVARPRASAAPADIGAVDLVIVAVKTWQIPEVAHAMAPLLHAHTMVVPFLNGVEAPDALAEVIGADRVLGGLSKIFALIEAPGVIRHFSEAAYVEIGEPSGGISARVEALREVFRDAGVEAGVSADIRSALWHKLLMVSSWAGLGALARSPMGQMRSQTETRALIGRAMDEGIAVGRARGHELAHDVKTQLWGFYDALPEQATASMQRDIMQGRPSELDAWNGAIVRFGAELGIDTPVHTFTYHTLLPMERRAREGG
jgi:2-dehydropantoate 2-reductase